MNELHLFAGAGGGILGGMLLGHTCVCAVEIEPYCREILLQRQRDGVLPRFPIWDDVRTFDGKPWRGQVDVVCGGFPCQDISSGGESNGTRKGIDGNRSGLWSEMARIVSEVRPRFVFVENSPMLVGRGLARVASDLAKMGYDSRWCVMGADAMGACHKRSRLWLVADSTTTGFKRGRENYSANGSGQTRRQFQYQRLDQDKLRFPVSAPKPYGVDARLANHVDRLAAVGNGQFPAVAATAWNVLRENVRVIVA